MSQIYKIGIAGSTRIEKVYVFIGDRVSDSSDSNSIDRLYAEDPDNELFRDVFSDEELEDIKEENTPLKFINGSIYQDDTIETVKKKIMMYLSEEETIAFGEIYLFGLERSHLEAQTVFETLTHNNVLP